MNDIHGNFYLVDIKFLKTPKSFDALEFNAIFDNLTDGFLCNLDIIHVRDNPITATIDAQVSDKLVSYITRLIENIKPDDKFNIQITAMSDTFEIQSIIFLKDATLHISKDDKNRLIDGIHLKIGGDDMLLYTIAIIGDLVKFKDLFKNNELLGDRVYFNKENDQYE